jgi:hypothetical protein
MWSVNVEQASFPRYGFGFHVDNEVDGDEGGG